ncbi:MAG: 23S rRNA (pseudouridine(1915)-N(3))-methyltransferase RlmH, partial [Verrucomicrobiia bacterium]
RLLAVSEGAVRVALDPGGWMGRTEEWVDRWEEWEGSGVKRVAFLVGGAEGHAQGVRVACERWSLGPITLQHELALVVLLEQLYRVQTIRRGEPYHRA